MSRTLPRAAGAIPGKLVSLITVIAAVEDTERFSRRTREDSSAESCERQAVGRWILVQNFFGMLRSRTTVGPSRTQRRIVRCFSRRRREIPRFARNDGGCAATAIGPMGGDACCLRELVRFGWGSH